MATGPGEELDLTRVVVIVLFLIVGSIYCRTFFHNYVSEPARAADSSVRQLETMRTSGFAPGPAPTPGLPGYERMHRMYQYITTADEQAKRWLTQDTKRRHRARHWVAIWGSLAVACISFIIVVSVGLPMLLERRA
ncbi:MAG: hypothetical protein KAW89_09710 [Armatimonadetes bacterium]|nr:hypothetical protein [Armatimonadota bacterium]